MARAKQNVVEIPIENKDADCHHMIRKVGAHVTESGAITADMADAAVRNWLQSGYRLAFCQQLGLDPDGTNILYIFVKNGNN